MFEKKEEKVIPCDGKRICEFDESLMAENVQLIDENEMTQEKNKAVHCVQNIFF